MNEIDTYVEILFFKLLEKGNEKYYKGAAKCGGMQFEVDGRTIILRWFRKCENDTYTNEPITIKQFYHEIFSAWKVCVPNSETGYHFLLEIDNLRQLTVRKLSRREEAEILDRIEEIANCHERETLGNIIATIDQL